MTTLYLLIFVLGLYVGQWLAIWGLVRLLVGFCFSLQQPQIPMLPPGLIPYLIARLLDLLNKK